jgi:hypothetical protein
VRTGRFNGATTARAFMSLMVKSVTAIPTCAMWSVGHTTLSYGPRGRPIKHVPTMPIEALMDDGAAFVFG